MAQQATVIAPENRPGNVKFEKIWNRAKDCDVASVVLYANGTVLCMDNGGRVMHALTADEVVDCCTHGCIIEKGGVYYRPASWAVSGDVASVHCTNFSSGSHALLTFTSYTA